MTRALYLDPDLAESHHVNLGGAEGRHAATVRRTQVGDQIDIANGRGLRVTIEVERVTKNDVEGRVIARAQEEPTGPRLVIVQALAKGGRDEQAVETCTEFGADEFIPWMSERTIVRWTDPKRAAKGREKLADAARAAAKQSRRSWVPKIGEVVTTNQLADLVRAFPGEVYVCHEEADVRLVGALPESANEIMIIVGPEGGITTSELDALCDAGGQAVLLGQHVLRSATAGAWASAVIRAKLS